MTVIFESLAGVLNPRLNERFLRYSTLLSQLLRLYSYMLGWTKVRFTLPKELARLRLARGTG